MIVKYKVFETSKDFEDWQNQLDCDISILEMSPVTTSVLPSSYSKDIYSSIGIFVTYTVTDEQN